MSTSNATSPFPGSSTPLRVTPWMVFLGVCAAAGAVVPWYFNLSYWLANGRMFTPGEFVAAGFTVSPLHSSIAADFVSDNRLRAWRLGRTVGNCRGYPDP